MSVQLVNSCNTNTQVQLKCINANFYIYVYIYNILCLFFIGPQQRVQIMVPLSLASHPLLVGPRSGRLVFALTEHLLHLLLDVLHPLRPLLPHLIFIVLCNGCVAHERDEAHVEQVGDV